MVNTEEFSKRLKIILKYHELSAATLAEKIEVQRSSISHILSGRNKPSLEFVLKVLKHFPDVELYWLLNGIGSFPKKMQPSSTGNTHNEQKDKIPTSAKIIRDKSLVSDKEIERIVIFYKDGTFKNYNS